MTGVTTIMTDPLIPENLNGVRSIGKQRVLLRLLTGHR